MEELAARYWVEILEAAMVAAALLFAAKRPSFARGAFEWAEQVLARVAEHRGLAILVAGVAPVVLRLCLLPLIPIPEPLIHDEFSHLLAADTLAHGRLANPPHPLWVHFESFHILQQPTYASMEPPGPGLVMAAGQVLFGHPWFGVCLGVGLMCASLCWMLRQWLTPNWALAGALVAGLRWGVIGYWMNSYWGGAVAAIGGALVLGAYGAMGRRPRWRAAVLLGVGLVALAASRPVEGALAVAPIMALLLWNEWRAPVLLAAAAVLALGVSGLLFYNVRVTGKPLVFPHTLNRLQYAVNPYLAWQKERPAPEYRHPEMRHFYVDFEAVRRADTLAHPWRRAVRLVAAYFRFYVGPLLLLPLIVLPLTFVGSYLARDRRYVAVALCCAAPWVSLAVTTSGFLAHYQAPALGALLLLVCYGLRAIREKGQAGLFLARALPVIGALMLGVAIVAQPLALLPASAPEYSWFAQAPPLTSRATVLRELESRPGKHLVIVHYAPGHVVHTEWVYNGADLSGARVVWARDMGAQRNAELLRAFPDRNVWTASPDEDPGALAPYPR